MTASGPRTPRLLRVRVNGQPRAFEGGTSVLEALARLQIHVPHLCSDPRLAAIGACRLCVVEVEGHDHPLPACATELAQGMVIETHTEALVQRRRTLLAWMARKYPPAAGGGEPDNPFLRELRAHGLDDESRSGVHVESAIDDAHPYIRVDMGRCIHCYRCERICAHLQGQFTWRVWNRGASSRFVPDSGTSLRASSCVGCGACADTCPSGALADKSVLELGEPARFTRTTCPYCGVGCEMLVGTRKGRIVQVKPALDAKVNKGHLCVKGRYAFGFTSAPDRLTAPLLREGGALREASWSEALQYVAQRLSAIRAAHGPDAIGVLGSARATNEENYLTQKFARVAIGTHNVDCCARVCHAPSAAALGAMLGTGAATNAFDDIERARTLLVFGANATENHPVIGARLRQAALGGANLVVADPRRTELARMANVHLRLRPGTDVPLLNALACAVLEQGLEATEFLDARAMNLAVYRQFVARFTPERVAPESSVDAASIRKAAELYARDRPALCVHGLGVTEHVQGTDAVMCLVNLALLTGNLGVPGAGVNPLRGQNNVQGSAHMGCEPAHLTGYARIEDARELFERVWGVALPRAPGLDLLQMLDAAAAGQLKALYAIGYDVLLTNPRAAATRAALAQLPLLVVQDLFVSETARELAHVVLPAASSFEKDGTFMNAERRIQRVRRVIDPPGQARTDAEIICALAATLGVADHFAFSHPEQIWNEVRAVWPAGRGISYARLEREGLQWPCRSEEAPGTAILHAERFASSEKAALRCIDYRPTPEAPDQDYPLLLVTGRKLYQFNAGTMTARTPNDLLQPADLLDLCPEDAARLGLDDGARVRVQSRYGSAELPIRLEPNVRSGQAFATFHTAAVFLNQVTGPHRDSVTNTPEYKVTAVRLERAACAEYEGAAPSRLP